MDKCYKFRIYPNAGQQKTMSKIFGCCRYVFNRFLAQRIEIYQTDGKSVSRFGQDKQLTELKKELEWLKEADSTALQAVIQNLESAYQNFFRRVKNNETRGFPKFKSKRDSKKSYKSKAVGKNIKLYEKSIKLPKLGLVECRVSKQIEGRIISATISQNPSGKYFVSVACTEIEIEPFEKTGAVTGIDVGIKDFAILADNISIDGEKIDNHKYLCQSEKKLIREQRRLSRKPKGKKLGAPSLSNRNRARIKVARIHEKISNQRSDFLHNLTTELVKTYDVISVESLKIKNVVKNHKLAKSISDVSWGEFVRQLSYKCEWYNNFVKDEIGNAC